MRTSTAAVLGTRYYRAPEQEHGGAVPYRAGAAGNVSGLRQRGHSPLWPAWRPK